MSCSTVGTRKAVVPWFSRSPDVGTLLF